MFPGLARSDNWTSVGTAVVMAAIDVARSTSTPLTQINFATATVHRAGAEYALTSDSPRVLAAVNQVSQLISSIPFARWPFLAGPALTQKRPTTTGGAGPLRLELDDNVVALLIG
jgi:hypothetical protein